MAQLGFFPNSCAATGNQTRVGPVAPSRGNFILHFNFVNFCHQASQTPDEMDKAKSFRWTKEQLKKFDNLIVKHPKQNLPNRNG